MKDLKRHNFFLGIEVLKSNQDIFISQKKYILNLYVDGEMIDCKSVELPTMANHMLQIIESVELVDRRKYYIMARRLIHLFHTRQVIAYAIKIVSRFIAYATNNHMKRRCGKGNVFRKDSLTSLQTQMHIKLEIEMEEN